MTMKLFVLSLKTCIVCLAFLFAFQIWMVDEICWDPSNDPAKAKGAKLGGRSRCFPMKIEEKCGNGRKSHKWWVPHVLKGDNKEYFCLPRFTIHTSIVLQTIWIIVFQGVHVITLIRRNFKSLSPLDFVPSFFSLAALSSLYGITYIVTSSWVDSWKEASFIPAIDPFAGYEWYLLVAIFFVLIDWGIVHRSYYAEMNAPKESTVQDTLDDGFLSSSDKEHDE